MKNVPPSDFRSENQVFFWVSQVHEARNRRLSRELKAFSLRVPEWRVLCVLYERGRVSMGTLAELSCIDRSTLSHTVERMVKDGRVVRISDAADMRVTRLRLTDAGRKLFEKVWPFVEIINQMAFHGLPEPAVGMVKWALSEMTSNLSEGLLATVMAETSGS